jgi:hypothetical protein
LFWFLFAFLTHQRITAINFPSISSPIASLEDLWTWDRSPVQIHVISSSGRSTHLLNIPPLTGTTLRRPTSNKVSFHECHSIIPTSMLFPDTFVILVFPDPNNLVGVSIWYIDRPSGLIRTVFRGSSLLSNRFIVTEVAGKFSHSTTT